MEHPILQESAIEAIIARRGCDRMTAFDSLRLLTPQYDPRAPSAETHVRYSPSELDQLLGARKNKGGAPPKWNWERAAIAVFGMVYRAEAKPVGEADVVRLLAQWFLDNEGREPGETMLKEHAGPLYAEISKP